MYHISTAMAAFQDDLRARGIEERVLSVTTSEFGRRIDSNGSFGTDHGTGGPLFIFGRGVEPGVVGKVPDLNTGNVEMQYDYRLIYGNIMRDWMLVDDTRLNEIFPGLMTANGTTDGVVFEQLPLAQQTITSTDSFIGSRFALKDCYPNPAREKTTVHFMLNSAYQVNVNLINSSGKQVKSMVDGYYEPGEHHIEVDLSGIPAGLYVYQFKTGFFKDSKQLVITK
jgi:hypothetical protein